MIVIMRGARSKRNHPRLEKTRRSRLSLEFHLCFIRVLSTRNNIVPTLSVAGRKRSATRRRKRDREITTQYFPPMRQLRTTIFLLEIKLSCHPLRINRNRKRIRLRRGNPLLITPGLARQLFFRRRRTENENVIVVNAPAVVYRPRATARGCCREIPPFSRSQVRLRHVALVNAIVAH